MLNELYAELDGDPGAESEIVLLHGWGMHGGVWGDFQKQLSANSKTHTVDLPGYGFSNEIQSDFSFEALTDAVEDYLNSNIKQKATIVAWSLSGLIALNLLNRKNSKINKVVFIASTPCFTQKNDWQHGLEQTVFDDFACELEADYKKTLQRFLSLQTRGSDIANKDLRELKNKLAERGEPNIEALKQGLNILSKQDLRTRKQYIVPALVLLGDKDTLVPVSIKFEFEKMFANVEIKILEKVGHAPFITQALKCSERIKKFINE